MTVMKRMSEEEAGKKPEAPSYVGKEKDDGDGAEVVGRGRKLLYTCFLCGAGNYVEKDWPMIVCWRCGGGSTGM
jgi:hypothetical protein